MGLDPMGAEGKGLDLVGNQSTEILSGKKNVVREH
jgi:hypothetical protein